MRQVRAGIRKPAELRARPGDKWHLDEVFIRINGKLYYLWRAVDQDGNVLDVLIQSRRNGNAAKRFFRKLLKGAEVRAAGDRHRQARQLPGHPPRADGIGRASPVEVFEQSSRELTSTHQAARTCDERFTSPGHAQRFLSAFGSISSHFRPNRHRLSAPGWRTEMTHRFVVWQEVTATDAAA